MNNTWGPGCDRLIFFVDKVAETIAVEQIDLHVAGDGELDGNGVLIPKAAAAMEWLAENATGYDWYLLWLGGLCLMVPWYPGMASSIQTRELAPGDSRSPPMSCLPASVSFCYSLCVSASVAACCSFYLSATVCHPYSLLRLLSLSQDLKTKISHAHSLILSYLSLGGLDRYLRWLRIWQVCLRFEPAQVSAHSRPHRPTVCWQAPLLW